jgi:hypothetical protein
VVRAEGLHDQRLRGRPGSGSRTKLLINSTARARGAHAASMLAGLQKGWTQTVDRLGVLVEPGSQDL